MFPENTAKPGELYYLLGEFFEARQKGLTKKEREIYKRLIKIADWFTLYEEMEKISDPIIRFTLRQYQEEYMEHFMLYHILQLDLSSKENPDTLARLVYLLGLLEEKQYSFAEFQGSVFSLQRRVEHLLKNRVKNWRKILHQVRDKRLSPLLKKCLKKSMEEMIHTISYVLFQEEKIRGDYQEFFHPRSHLSASLINGHKKALPISIGILFLLISQRLHFPIYGISLPKHFFLKFEVPGLEFFIDPFNEGKILPKASLLHFLKTSQIPFSLHLFLPCSYRFLLQRSIESLIPLYRKRKEKRKEAILRELRYQLTFS